MTRDIGLKEISSSEILRTIWNEEGIRGLYRGALMRVMYLSVGGFAFFGIFEEVKRRLN